MDKNRIYGFLEALGSTIAANQNRENWVIASCPLAPWKHEGGTDNNPSFGVKISNTGKSFYYCFSCGCHGNLSDLPIEVQVRNQEAQSGLEYQFHTAVQLAAQELEDVELDIPDYGVIKKPETIIWPEAVVNSFPRVHLFPSALNYLTGRQVTKGMIKAFDLRFDTNQNRIVFPIRDWNKDLVGLVGRDITGKHPVRYYLYKDMGKFNKLPWFGEDRVDLGKPVVFVEAVFDYLSVYRVYKNVLASLGAGLSQLKLKRVNMAMDIITLYDYGKGGDAARHAISKYLKSAIVSHEIPTEQQDDPGNMTKKEIKERLQGYIDV